MRFTAIKSPAQAPADARPPAAPSARPSTDLLTVTSDAASALLRAEGPEAVLQALLAAATRCGAARPRAGLWRDEETSLSMWQLDGAGAMVGCGSAPASLYAGALALEADSTMVGSLIPISSPGRRWGVLDVSGQINDGSALSVLAIVARQAAMALERNTDSGSSNSGALVGVLDRWWDAPSINALLRQALPEIAHLAHAESCGLALLDTMPGGVKCLLSEDLAATDGAPMAGMSSRPWAEHPAGDLPWLPNAGERRNNDAINLVLRTSEPLAFRWNPTSEALKAGIIPSGPAEGSYAAHPLSAGGSTFGVLDIRASMPRAFGDGQDEILALSARMLARILSTKRADACAIADRKRQELLTGLGLELASKTDAVQAATTITAAARDLWPAADLVYVMLPQGEGGLWSIAALDSAKPEDQRHGWARSGEGFAGWVIQSRQPLAVGSAADDPRRGALDRGQNVQSGAWVPMMRDEVLLGLVAVAFTSPAAAITPEDVDLMERIAEQGAASLERVRDRHSTQAAFWDAIEAISGAIDARDGYTHGHSRNVTEYAVAIAQRMESSPSELQTVRAAALLHDIGKIGIPDHILNKPGRLTPDERTVMESHPEVGYEILQRAPSLQPLLPTVRFHHERPDGKGYPLGLTGNSLPIQARIVAVADAFDAMTSDRVYRKRMSVEKAVAILTEGRGTQWDEASVDAFVEIVREKGTPRLQMLTAEDSGRQYLPSLGMDVFGT